MKNNKKKAPIISACVIIGILTIFLATVILPLIKEVYGFLIAIVILGIYGIAVIAVIIGVSIALHQRLKEIESGEEEEAKKC